MPVWRVVQKGWATLEEVERSWNLEDIRKANALLDYEHDAAELASKGNKP